jgi:antitoxin component YwqK of YwqJK toxin-antitoxin module
MYVHGQQLGIYITWKKTGALKCILFNSARPSEKLHISFYTDDPSYEIEIEILHSVDGDDSPDYYDAAAMDQTIHKLETYDADQLNGQSICFYPNGQIKTDAMYKNDQLHGDFKEYDQQGKLILDAIYVDGKQAYVVFQV